MTEAVTDGDDVPVDVALRDGEDAVEPDPIPESVGAELALDDGHGDAEPLSRVALCRTESEAEGENDDAADVLVEALPQALDTRETVMALLSEAAALVVGADSVPRIAVGERVDARDAVSSIEAEETALVLLLAEVLEVGDAHAEVRADADALTRDALGDTEPCAALVAEDARVGANEMTLLAEALSVASEADAAPEIDTAADDVAQAEAVTVVDAERLASAEPVSVADDVTLRDALKDTDCAAELDAAKLSRALLEALEVADADGDNSGDAVDAADTEALDDSDGDGDVLSDARDDELLVVLDVAATALLERVGVVTEDAVGVGDDNAEPVAKDDTVALGDAKLDAVGSGEAVLEPELRGVRDAENVAEEDCNVEPEKPEGEAAPLLKAVADAKRESVAINDFVTTIVPLDRIVAADVAVTGTDTVSVCVGTEGRAEAVEHAVSVVCGLCESLNDTRELADAGPDGETLEETLTDPEARTDTDPLDDATTERLAVALASPDCDSCGLGDTVAEAVLVNEGATLSEALALIVAEYVDVLVTDALRDGAGLVVDDHDPRGEGEGEDVAELRVEAVPLRVLEEVTEGLLLDTALRELLTVALPDFDPTDALAVGVSVALTETTDDREAHVLREPEPLVQGVLLVVSVFDSATVRDDEPDPDRVTLTVGDVDVEGEGDSVATTLLVMIEAVGEGEGEDDGDDVLLTLTVKVPRPEGEDVALAFNDKLARLLADARALLEGDAVDQDETDAVNELPLEPDATDDALALEDEDIEPDSDGVNVLEPEAFALADAEGEAEAECVGERLAVSDAVTLAVLHTDDECVLQADADVDVVGLRDLTGVPLARADTLDDNVADALADDES